MSNKICVFGASAKAIDPVILNEVMDLCEELGLAGFSLVFGGFAQGMMEAAANGFEKAGASIIGVVPKSLLEKRRVYPACTQVIETDSLDQRKERMIDLADIFLVLPGAVGTLDELFTVMAQKTAGESEKPILIFNQNGFYNPLTDWLMDLENLGIMKKPLKDLVFIGQEKTDLIDYLSSK